MDEKKLLQKIGLSENESEIYIVLLKLGPLSAYEMAQKTGIYRPHVYDKLQTLIHKGLVSYIQRGSKKIFSAAPPSKLMDILKEKEEQIKNDISFLLSNLTSLNNLYSLPKEDTKVEVLTGIEGLKLMLNDIAKSSVREIMIFGLNDSRYNDALPIFIPQYFKLLKAKNATERVITRMKKDIFLFKNKVTQYRFLETPQIDPVNTLIYGNKVGFVIWGTPITSIIMENKQLAETYKEHFECLWSIAKKKN